VLEKLEDASLLTDGDNGGVEIGSGTAFTSFVHGQRCDRKDGSVAFFEEYGAGLPVTQTDDPPSGGHFSFGMSKPPP